MKARFRLLSLFVWMAIALVLVVAGTAIESSVLDFTGQLGKSSPVLSMALFFASVNINVLLLFVLVFLTFRNGVKLVVEVRKGLFGSHLRTKLVTAFLFFALLPTVILLYISTKFVNANFERWLPQGLVQTTEASLSSEVAYREKIVSLLRGLDPARSHPEALDFVYDAPRKSFLHLSGDAAPFKASLATALQSDVATPDEPPHWVGIDKARLAALKRTRDGRIVGILAPPSIHPRWQLVTMEFSQARPGVEIVRVSYYVMLGVLTLLIVFSATWLGFTVAREFTIPIQVLASATESVAQGNYAVKIDDIVTDDEIGKLALSFRSMVSDLNLAKVEAERASAEIQTKAAELWEKSEYNAILLRDINAAVASLDERGLIESWNQQAELLFGVPEEAALGRRIEELFEPHFHESLLAPALRELYASDSKRLMTEYSGRIAGQDRQLHVSISEVISPKGRAGTVIFVNDLTELARAQRLAAWREVARRIAHEIKNPLTPIKLGAQRLQRRFQSRFEAEEAATFDECVKIILHCTESIKGLVDEFIKFARMPQPNMREGDLGEAVRMAVSGFEDNAEHVPVRFEAVETIDGLERAIDDPTRLNWSARFDKDQIVRLFVNLISNAVAASAPMRTPVVVRAEAFPASRALRVRVLDWGVGIPDDTKAKIFEPYFSTTRTGTGLGLVIVQQIVRDHGGRLTLEDNTPRGSVFVVEIPLGTGSMT